MLFSLSLCFYIDLKFESENRFKKLKGRGCFAKSENKTRLGANYFGNW